MSAHMIFLWRTIIISTLPLGIAKTSSFLIVNQGACSQIKSDKEVKYQIIDLDLPASLLWAIVSTRTVLYHVFSPINISYSCFVAGCGP